MVGRTHRQDSAGVRNGRDAAPQRVGHEVPGIVDGGKSLAVLFDLAAEGGKIRRNRYIPGGVDTVLTQSREPQREGIPR